MDRFELLLDRYQDGEAAADEAAELETILRGDPSKRRRLVERFLLEVQLHKVFSGLVSTGRPARTPLGKIRWARLLAAAAIVPLVVGILALSSVRWAKSRGPSVESGQVRVDGAVVARIPAGTQFEVGDTTARIRLQDGSHADFDPSSTASIQNGGDGTRQSIELARGGGTFQVVPGGGQFRVTTSVGTVTALGTEFSVRLRDPATRKSKKGRQSDQPTLAVAVTKGSVRVESEGKSYVLTAGESQTFDEDGAHNDKDDGDQNDKNDGDRE